MTRSLAHARPAADTTTTLSSNGVPLDVGDEHFAPMLDSTSLLGDPGSLRRRFADDGYLLLRGVLDASTLWGARAAYFAGFPDGYLKNGTDPRGGIFSGRRPTGLPAHGVGGHPAHAFVRSRLFAQLTEDDRLSALAEALLGGPAALVPRRVLRHFDSQTRRASRAHVDNAYPSNGSGAMVTMWIPIGDCPVQTGGIVYLSGSHRLDRALVNQPRVVSDRPHDARPISHDLNWTARQLHGKWLWANFGAGDIAVHCPYIVHASLDVTTQAMRLSADIRFQPTSDQVNPDWAKPWAGDDGA